MNKQDFLLEIGCEELPPKNIVTLAKALASGIEQGLVEAGIFPGEHCLHWYAAPRRLAVMVNSLVSEQPEQQVERRGPAMSAAYDAQGKPSKALLGFTRSCDTDIASLQTLKTEKGEWLYYKAVKPGLNVFEILPDIIQAAVKKLPIAKPMRWGDSDVEFIRPVHWVVMLYGKDVVPATLLGKQTDRLTYGHRFHHPAALSLQQASDYLPSLENKGQVLADFTARRNVIVKHIKQAADSVAGQTNYSQALLDEVTAIVEWPDVLLADFSADFLQVPQEALVSAMQGHQKSFPVFSADNKLLPHFIFVANIASKDPQQVIKGNQKVMQARLSDAAFFYQTDLKQPLSSHLEGLKNVIFQNKLGSLYNRSQRMATLAKFVANELAVEPASAEQAALLAKCDLMTNMVYEFPELQGVMGSYYAKHDGLSNDVCQAIEQHYLPAGLGDDLPSSALATCVALADKVDLLVAIFSIGKKPTGDKDPFALRRAAIGIIRILLSLNSDIDLKQLITQAGTGFVNFATEVADDVLVYLHERLKYYYLEQGEPVQFFNAVNNVKVDSLHDFANRLQAVKAFVGLSAASSLAEANKRVKNILSKQDALNLQGMVNVDLFELAAEHDLYQAILRQQQTCAPLLVEKNYQQILQSLASLQPLVTQFFTDVMVMVDNAAIKNNRLLLLNQLRNLFLTVADVSCLT